MTLRVPQEPKEGQPKRKRRWYSDQDRADAMAVLEAQGGNCWVTSKKTGISYTLLRQWQDAVVHPEGERQPIATAEVRDRSKKDLAGALDTRRWQYLDRLGEPEAVKQTSGYYAAMTFKVLNEAHQLLTGGATSRTELSLASFLGSIQEPSALALPAGDQEQA